MCTNRCINKDCVCMYGILFNHGEGAASHILYVQSIGTLRALHYDKTCHRMISAVWLHLYVVYKAVKFTNCD